jgi:hypothetical protein
MSYKCVLFTVRISEYHYVVRLATLETKRVANDMGS